MKPGAKVDVIDESGRRLAGTVREYEPPLYELGECVTIDLVAVGLPGVFYRYPERDRWHVWGAPRGTLYSINEV